MNKFLNDIRSAENPISGNRKIINTIAVLFLGIVLGIFSKFLDFRQVELSSVFMAIDGALDVHYFSVLCICLLVCEREKQTGIVNFCKEANEIVVANRDGLPKLILMSRDVYKNGLGKVTKDVYFK